VIGDVAMRRSLAVPLEHCNECPDTVATDRFEAFISFVEITPLARVHLRSP
jgi:hypothetical protein